MVAILFAFWVIMSGVFEAKVLVPGFVACVVSAWITRPLTRLKPVKSKDRNYLIFYFPYGKFFVYWLWLMKEIVKANIYVIKLVLNPKLPIDPVVVSIKNHFDNPLAVTAYANSITLTPGTITLAVEDGVFYVHAITREAGLDTAPADDQPTEMARRVAEVFGEKARN